MAKKNEETSLATYDEELAALAREMKKSEESNVAVSMLSFRSGKLSCGGNKFKNNELYCIVLFSLLENAYYGTEKYDADNPTPPVCFALGLDAEEMEPHKVVIDAKRNCAGSCSECDYNKWGSAETGKGKACRNLRRIAVIPCGDMEGKKFEFYDDDFFPTAKIALAKIPPTSTREYSSFVSQVTNVGDKPTCCFATRLYVEDDDKTQFKVKFDVIKEIPNKLIPVILKRVSEAKTILDQPYQLEQEEKKPAAKKGKGSKKF